MLKIERTYLVDASSWGTTLFHCLAKNQNYVSLFTGEAEYIVAGSSCTQILRRKKMLKKHNVKQDVMTLYCDNMSTISISKNLVQHNCTKHIDICHNFIRELVEEKVITLDHVPT